MRAGLDLSRLRPARVLRGLRRRLAGGEDPASPWKAILRREARAWRKAVEAARHGPRVLLATSMGGYPHGALVESTLAIALTLRGARVEVLLCDGLPACQLTEIAAHPPQALEGARPQPRCATCVPHGRKVFEPLGLPIHWYGSLVTPAQRESAAQVADRVELDCMGEYRRDGLAVGEHALAGALRYFARGTLAGEPAAARIARRYLEAATLTAYALEHLLAERQYEVACFNHGIYVPQGLIGEVCRRRGVRVVNWNPAYRRHCFIFSHGDTYHHTMITEPTEHWEHLPWTPELERATLEYLKSRWQGTQDWIYFHDRPVEDADSIARELGVDFTRPCIALLTSVMWDAQLHYASNAFPNMVEWVFQTIAYFARRPELQLLIRVHPAEVRGAIPSRQPMVAEIQRAFPRLPPNVFVIPPQSQASTYAIVERSNAVLIYNTKTGIEVASMGVPVIVAGEAWIRNKGFSLDATTPDEYFALLDRLPLATGLSARELERARKYAFHFFFRRMIPLPFMSSLNNSDMAASLERLDALRPGRYPGLDVICDAILQGTPCIYPAERLLAAGAR